MASASPPRQVQVVFGSTAVEADPRELLEHLDTPSLMKPFLEMPPEEDRALFMQCMAELHESLVFLEGIPQLECCVTEHQQGSAVLGQAVAKLQTEALSLLRRDCIRLQRDPHLKLLARKAHPPQPDSADPAGGTGAAEHKQAPPLPELVPAGTLETVGPSVEAIARCGHSAELLQAYVEQRQAWQEEAVKDLGLVALLAEDVGSARWEKLEDMIGTWNEQLRMLTSLAAMEDALASLALKGVADADRKQTVASLATFWLKPLLAIGASVADGKKSPEKMVPFLDMTESLLDAQTVFRKLALVGHNSPLAMVEALRESVRACVRATAEEFKRLIVEDDVVADPQQQQQPPTSEAQESGQGSAIPSATSTSQGRGHRRIRELFSGLKTSKGKGPEDAGEKETKDRAAAPSAAFAASAADGDVQKITKYVANFILFLMQKDLPFVALLSPTMGSMEAVSAWLQSIMSALSTNLEIKAAALPGDSLQQLFLMNNKNYIIGKLDSEQSAAKEMLGKKWIEETRSQLEMHRDGYIAFALQPFELILSSDRDRDPALFYNRVNAFNSAFDDLCQRQKLWRVPNADLSSLIKLEETNGIVIKYKEFLNSHRHCTQGSRTPRVRLLTTSEIEARISESFPAPERRK